MLRKSMEFLHGMEEETYRAIRFKHCLKKKKNFSDILSFVLKPVFLIFPTLIDRKWVGLKL